MAARMAYHPPPCNSHPRPTSRRTGTSTKPAASGRRGMVVSQSKSAAEAGVAVLDAGGNAIDAAVATALALAAVEPWNSGLGGIGHALVHRAGEARAEAVDFGPTRRPRSIPSRFKLTGKVAADLFGWPEVEGDTNIHGPLSFVIPSAVAGYAEMHRRWGRLPLAEIAAPAIALAKRGLPQDWYTTLKVATSAPILRQYPESARIYLRDGLPPIAALSGRSRLLPARASCPTRWSGSRRPGWRDFYEGEIAASDRRRREARMGGVLSARGSARLPGARAAGRRRCRGAAARCSSPARSPRRRPPPTCCGGMATCAFGAAPDAAWYVALARALKAAYAQRLTSLGDAEPQAAESCTTHITVCDADGTMVAMTTTLLSSMGSRVVLPADRHPDEQRRDVVRSAPGPAELDRAGQAAAHQHVPGDPARRRAALDRGRRVRRAPHHGVGAAADVVRRGFRHDAGGRRAPAAHRRVRPRQGHGRPAARAGDHRARWQADGPVEIVEHGVLPINFACPNLIVQADGTRTGISDAASPWSAAVARRGC